MDNIELATWFLDSLTPARTPFGEMNPPGHEGKYITRHANLTPTLIVMAWDGKKRYPSDPANKGKRLPTLYSFAARLRTKDGVALCAALDVDDGGAQAAGRVLTVCAEYGLWAFASLSQSQEHDGAHVWIPCDRPTSADMLLGMARRIQAHAQVKGEVWPTKTALRLPIMPHLWAPGGPRIFPLLTQDGELIQGDAWSMAARLRDIWRPNDPAAVWEADRRLPCLSVAKPALRHKSQIKPTDTQKVIDWYVANISLEEALADVGLTLDGRRGAYLCPFHDDHNPSMGILTHPSGHQVARCFVPTCPAHKPYDSFNIFCHVHEIDAHQAVYRIAQEYGIGRKRELQVETHEADPEPARPLDAHLADLAKSRQDLEAAIADAATRRGHVTLIRTEPGVGKTSAAIKRANADHAAGKTVCIIVPNHEHGRREWAEKLTAPYVWQPRNALCECYSRAQLKAWGELGYAAPRCTSPDCPYQTQREAAKGKQVIFQYPHLTLHDGDLLADADLVIIDETPAGALVEANSCTVNELRALGDKGGAVLSQALVKVANAHYHQFVAGLDLVKALRRHIPELEQAVAEAQAHYKPHPPAPAGIEGLPARAFYGELLAALAHDLTLTEGKGNPLLAWTRQGDEWRYVWRIRRRMLKKAIGTLTPPAVLVLDGSADEVLYRRLLTPWPVDLVEITAPVSPVVRIVQAPTATYTRFTFTDPARVDSAARQVALVCNQFDCTLDGIIAYKSVAARLGELLGGDTSLHYGNQRGRNGLETARNLAVIASPTAPPDEMFLEACAIFADDTPIDPASERQAVATYRYADDRLARVVSQHTTEELRQAIHRARVVSRTEPTTVFVFSPWPLAPLGLPVTDTVKELPYGNSQATHDALAAYQARQSCQDKADILKRQSSVKAILQFGHLCNPVEDKADYPQITKTAELYNDGCEYQPCLGSNDAPATPGMCSECDAPAVAVTSRGPLCAGCIEWHATLQAAPLVEAISYRPPATLAA